VPLASWATPYWGGEIDVYETDSTLVAQVSVPGVRPDQIEVEEDDGVLTVHIEQTDERQIQIWERCVRLPADVQGNRAEATLHNGVLTISLPKAASSSVRRIPINGVQSRRQLALPRPHWLSRLGLWLR
jgi:HSP20 family protein